MRIALIGYGKMGKAIEDIALKRGHKIVLRIGIENLEDFSEKNLQQADVAIEFTGPHSAFHNISKCLNSGINVVSGSTGWLDKLEETKQIALEAEVGFLYASNFSLGVNLFFALNKYLARLIAPHQAYNVSIEEIHHTAKLDAPSGTAITLAEQILPHQTAKKGITLNESEQKDYLFIESKRIDPAPGTHVVRYVSEIDTLSIEHEAHSRTGFAIGAVIAAEYLDGKKGIFAMQDVLGL
jgi:4-hydroxy-tetrahydrodipicolinate reductase